MDEQTGSFPVLRCQVQVSNKGVRVIAPSIYSPSNKFSSVVVDS